MRQAMAAERWSDAERIAAQWLAQGERDWQISLNLAICRSRLNRGNAGAWLELAEAALEQSGGHPAARLGLAEVAIDAGRWEQALTLLTEADVSYSPGQRWPRRELQARALARLGRGTEACRVLDTIEPSQRGWRWAMALADIRVQDCDWSAAEAVLRQVLQRHPQLAIAHQNLAIVLLSQQRCQEAWPHYEWRRGNPRLDSHGCPRPLPPLEKLQGRNLVVIGEQGIGDQIMVSRYLPALAALAGSVVIEPAGRLVPLLRRLLPSAVAVEPPSTQANDHKHDQQTVVIGMASLPLLFWPSVGTTTCAAASNGYLSADPGRQSLWQARLAALGPGLRLGLGWLGGTNGSDWRQRSLTPSDRQQLLNQAGIQWVDLQYLGSDQHPAASEQQQHGLHRFGAVGHDLEETLALMACLDGVVSTRQTVALLAGGLGLQGQVLVPARPEWRYWGNNNRWSWYPSLELLHQQQRGSWVAELVAIKQRWTQSDSDAVMSARS